MDFCCCYRRSFKLHQAKDLHELAVYWMQLSPWIIYNQILIIRGNNWGLCSGMFILIVWYFCLWLQVVKTFLSNICLNWKGQSPEVTNMDKCLRLRLIVSEYQPTRRSTFIVPLLLLLTVTSKVIIIKHIFQKDKIHLTIKLSLQLKAIKLSL